MTLEHDDEGTFVLKISELPKILKALKAAANVASLPDEEAINLAYDHVEAVAELLKDGFCLTDKGEKYTLVAGLLRASLELEHTDDPDLTPEENKEEREMFAAERKTIEDTLRNLRTQQEMHEDENS